MFNEKKKKVGLNQYSDEIKEVSIRKKFPDKPIPELEHKIFLYCDPPEVILQSKIFKFNIRHRKE